MGKNLRIDINDAGLQALMKSPEMDSFLKENAARIAGACGKGYDYNALMGRKRATARVFTETRAAARDNMQNNTILKAVRP